MNNSALMEKLNNMHEDLNKIEEHLKTLNGHVQRHETYFWFLKGLTAVTLIVGGLVGIKSLIGG